MRIVSFKGANGPRLGVRLGDEIADIGTAAPGLPGDLAQVLALGDNGRAALAKAAEGAPRLPLAGLTLLPPVTRPGKILCLGLNYAGHARETGQALPDFPVLFLRAATSLVGHGAPILRPKVSDLLDYEGEFAFVIGTRCRHVPREAALSVVAGYAPFNDGSVRDYQMKTPQWTIGKNFDDTGGFGPELVTADELPPGASGLRLVTRLNGEVMQDTNTDDLIFDVPVLIEMLSACMTLEPGDVVVTGTPSGVGGLRKPPVFMKPGDVVEVELEGTGVLSNPIEQEKA